MPVINSEIITKILFRAKLLTVYSELIVGSFDFFMKTLVQTMRKLNKEQFEELKYFCHRSNSLYNSALFEIKKHYEETGKFLRYESLYHIMKSNWHYQQMPSKIACQTLKLLEQSYKSFFALIKTDQEVMPPV